MHVCIYTNIDKLIILRIYIYIYIYIYIRLHKHTHTHTHIYIYIYGKLQRFLPTFISPSLSPDEGLLNRRDLTLTFPYNRFLIFWITLFFFFLYIYIYIYIKVKLATIVEGDPKAPFSIATTSRCRGGRYSIPWIASLYP